MGQQFVSLYFIWGSSVRVYTLIHWHVSGTSQGSCNLDESTAEGRVSYVCGGGWGWTRGIHLFPHGLTAPNRKHIETVHSVEACQLRESLQYDELWGHLCVCCLKCVRAVVKGIKGTQSTFLALCSVVSPYGYLKRPFSDLAVKQNHSWVQTAYF